MVRAGLWGCEVGLEGGDACPEETLSYVWPG